jgi:hypothetical protein
MTAVRSSGPVEREAWSENLRELFESLEIPAGLASDNLVSGVAHYCQEFHPHGVQRADLVLLVARAFCVIGERESAARVLRSIRPHARHVDRWLDILAELHHFPALLPYFSRGIIRPAEWAGARMDRMWTLDLGRLALSDSERHEMMLYRSLRSLIDGMMVIWDGTRGEGVLGLRGLEAFNLESHKEARSTVTLPGDLLDYVTMLFQRQRHARSWRTVPTIMNLDLQGNR